MGIFKGVLLVGVLVGLTFILSGCGYWGHHGHYGYGQPVPGGSFHAAPHQHYSNYGHYGY